MGYDLHLSSNLHNGCIRSHFRRLGTYEHTLRSGLIAVPTVANPFRDPTTWLSKCCKSRTYPAWLLIHTTGIVAPMKLILMVARLAIATVTKTSISKTTNLAPSTKSRLRRNSTTTFRVPWRPWLRCPCECRAVWQHQAR